MSDTDWEILVAPDFEGDVTTYSKPDGQGGLLIRSVQDVGPILERNKALQTANDGYNADRDIRRVATIPAIVRQYFVNQEGWDPGKPHLYPEKMVQLLNDPDWAFLRTAPGRIGLTNGIIR